MDSAARSTCRMTGALAGLLVVLSLGLWGSVGWLAALLLGALAGILLGAVLVWLVCEGVPAGDGGIGEAPRRAEPSDDLGAAALLAASGAAMPPAAMDMIAALPAEDGGQRTEAPEAASDLMRLKGVGEKMASALAGAGVQGCHEVAAWDEAAIDRIAADSGISAARIRREDWVGQARRLAAADGAKA